MHTRRLLLLSHVITFSNHGLAQLFLKMGHQRGIHIYFTVTIVRSSATMANFKIVDANKYVLLYPIFV